MPPLLSDFQGSLRLDIGSVGIQPSNATKRGRLVGWSHEILQKDVPPKLCACAGCGIAAGLAQFEIAVSAEMRMRKGDARPCLNPIRRNLEAVRFLSCAIWCDDSR